MKYDSSTAPGKPVKVTRASGAGKSTSLDLPFKLECVIVCNEYADFLVRTLPTNKALFDRVIVVTAPEDLETRRVCEFYNVECLQTDLLRSRWNEFHKGAAINEGLGKLDKAGWVVQMDADIWLPCQARLLLERAKLAPSMVYGIDRFDIRGFPSWDEFLSMPKLQHEGMFIHAQAFPIGTRVMFEHTSGYVPLGFFQMWCPSVSGINNYPSNHDTAGRTDILFSMQWPRGKRGMIPEIIGYHLMGDESNMGANWAGRTTPSFARQPLKHDKLP